MEKYQRLDFRDEISSNKLKSFFLIAFIFIVFVLLGYVISMALDSGLFFVIMIISIVISILYIWISYYYSAEISVASVGAVKAEQSEYRDFHNLVEGIAIASGLPKPRLYIMNNEQINAFASGRDPKHAVVCVTTGALKKLDRRELEGVLAHEMSHVSNYDIRYMTLVAVMVGMIAIISEMFLRSLWMSGSKDSDSKGNVIFLVIGIVLAILAPIVVQLVQLAISRKREYTADASAVKFTRYPKGLIGALKKIKGDYGNVSEKKVSKAIAPLFFASPMVNLLSTHPPINKRIEILERM